MKKDIIIRYSLSYSDNSGDRMSLEIDTKNQKDYQVKINNEKVWCSIEELEWLQENINRALQFIKKENKNG